MTATNHDGQLGEIYPTTLNELNCTFGVSFFTSSLMWPSCLWLPWYRPLCTDFFLSGGSRLAFRAMKLSVLATPADRDQLSYRQSHKHTQLDCQSRKYATKLLSISLPSIDHFQNSLCGKFAITRLLNIP